MKKKDFENLKAGLQEVVEIERGEREPSRSFVIEKIIISPDGKFVTTRRFCKKCNSLSFVRLVRDITSNGISQIYWQCQVHHGGIHSPRKNIKHEKVKSLEIVIENLPVINNNSEFFVCKKCGAIGAANHHWSPKHLFEDAEDWPQDYLCNECHDKWHNIVTPGMYKK